MPEVMELTDREKAILRGEDPDQAANPPEEPAASVTDDAGGGTEAPAAPEPEKEPERQVESKDDTASWIDDDAKTLAASYGIGDDELKQFGSRDEFSRAASFLDRNLAELGAKSRTPPEPDPAKEPEAKPADDAAEKKTPAGKRGLLDVKTYTDAGYDEHTLALVKAHNEMVEDRERFVAEQAKMQQALGGFHQWMSEAMHTQKLNTFHDLVDGMEEDLFGRSLDKDGNVLSLKPEHTEARKKLYETADALEAGLVAQAQRAGKQPNLPPARALLERAKQLTFGEELRKRQAAEYQRKVAEQSKRRRSAAGRPRSDVASPVKTQPAATQAEEARRIAEHPEIVKFWKQIESENGA